ncbi:hypothetical protein [Streptomyces sp. NPDC101132]|uniref:hypothetical protein n=1 Tax=Streptomyces sp. NPDC101132 TaxID=3366110 RepID=UPI0038200C6E
MGGPVPWQALTDLREWTAQPLDLPSDPAAWHQLAAVGGWQAVVVDSVFPLAQDLLTARCTGTTGRARGWFEVPYAVPVLCAAASAEGVQALQQAVMAMSAEGLALHRAVAVLVATSEGRRPAVVRAAATMLSGRTAAVVHLPCDSGVRGSGLRAGRVQPRTQQAAAQLAAAVLSTAHDAWGDPLPAAAQPVPLAASSVPLPFPA